MDQNGQGNDPRPPVGKEHLDAIMQFDTCTIANAIEQFGVRLRNEGFSNPGLTSVTGWNQRAIGYAMTFRVKTSDPPLVGGKFGDRSDWWDFAQQMKGPKVAVMENIDLNADGGACVGEVHTAILKAFGFSGVVTNGAVRDINGLTKLDFPVFARAVSVSHSYMHIVETGAPVEILGLSVRQGDLIFADRYGVVQIPVDLAPQIPEVAARIRQHDRRIIEFCLSPEFSAQGLKQVIEEQEPPKE